MALMQIDPDMANGYKDMYMQRKNLEKEKTSSVYTPEQKRLIDAKEQNRLEMQKAQSSATAAQTNKNKKSYIYWMKQVDKLKANDLRIKQALVATGLNEYMDGSSTSDNTQTVIPTGNGTDEDSTQTGKGTDEEISNYEKAKSVVTEALAVKDGYTTSDNKIKAKQALNDFNAKLGQFPLSNEELKALQNIIDSAKIPGAGSDSPQAIQKAFDDLKKAGPTIVTAGPVLNALASDYRGILANYNTNANQSYYIALKKTLGDAIGSQDFSGLAGFQDAEGLKAKLKGFLNNAEVSPEKARQEIKGFVDTFNASVKAFNDKMNQIIKTSNITNKGGIEQFKNNYSVSPVVIPSSSSSTTEPKKPLAKDYATLDDFKKAMAEYKKKLGGN